MLPSSPGIFYIYLAVGIPLFAILIPVTAAVWKRSSVESGRGALAGAQRELRWLLLAVTLYLFFNILELLAPGRGPKMALACVCYVFIAAIPTWWFIFALEYSGLGWLSRSLKRFLWIIPAFAFLVPATNEFHHLIWRDWTFMQAGPFLSFRALGYGPWFWFLWTYLMALTLLGTMRMIVVILSRSRSFNSQGVFVLLGTATPVVVNFVYVTRLIEGFNKDFSSIAFGFAGLFFAAGVFYDRLFDLVPIARRAMAEALADPLVAVDSDGRVVDSNAAARQVCGISDEATRIMVAELPFLARVVELCAASKGIPIEESPDGARWYEVGVSTICAGKRSLSLYSMRDVTERRRLLEEKTAIVEKLFRALAEIRTLEGIIPICACCKKVRDDSGFWQQVESYVSSHTQAEFSHGICPDCRHRLYPDFEDESEKERGK